MLGWDFKVRGHHGDNNEGKEESCKIVVGLQEYATMQEAGDSLEQFVDISLKNRKENYC
jgi:hypothetical protein